MPKPHFIFTQYKNSLRVDIPNLEALDIATIQNIEQFVATRKGYFDFATYSFVLQKRLEYKAFQQVVKASGLAVEFEHNQIEKKIKPRVGFGQYKGLFYSELPDSYLIWLKNNYRGKDKTIIEYEVKNRNL